MTKTLSAPKAVKRRSKTAAAETSAPSKLDTMVSLLRKSNGATIQELAAATNWQRHSVRGALAGTLKKKGHSITSEKLDGTRRYRIEEAKA